MINYEEKMLETLADKYRKSKKDRQNRMADHPAAAYRPDTAGGGRNRFPRTAVPARPDLPDPLARLA